MANGEIKFFLTCQINENSEMHSFIQQSRHAWTSTPETRTENAAGAEAPENSDLWPHRTVHQKHIILIEEQGASENGGL